MFPHPNGLVEKALSPRETAKKISENSLHVKINKDAIKTLATSISAKFIKQEYSLSNWKLHELHPKVADEAAIDAIFAIDILNFSFWPNSDEEKFSVKYNGKIYTGYWSLVAAINRAHDEGIPFCTAEYMSSVTEAQLLKVFRSESGAIPLLPQRVMAMNEAGRVLLDTFDGSFVNCVKQCNNDVISLLKILTENFTSLQDLCSFEDSVYSFLKRAQIIVADVWGCFEGKGLGYFKNIEELTMFADYRVPQTLEYFDVVSYSKELKEKLEDIEILDNGSRYEVEIRGCSIKAVEDLRHEVLAILNKDGAPKDVLDVVNSVTLDFYLWDFARGHRKEMAHLPFHRTRCIYY